MHWAIWIYLVGFSAQLLISLVWLVVAGKEGCKDNAPNHFFLTTVLWPIFMWVGRR